MNQGRENQETLMAFIQAARDTSSRRWTGNGALPLRKQYLPTDDLYSRPKSEIRTRSRIKAGPLEDGPL